VVEGVLEQGHGPQHGHVRVLGPTICRPTGMPSAVNPAQTVPAGERVMLNG
jgi:hypothetical protein